MRIQKEKWKIEDQKRLEELEKEYEEAESDSADDKVEVEKKLAAIRAKRGDLGGGKKESADQALK